MLLPGTRVQALRLDVSQLSFNMLESISRFKWPEKEKICRYSQRIRNCSTASNGLAAPHAPDGSPIIAVKTGGDKEPAVFITAGSHSTEQAGVSAAVALIEQLDTDHQVYVLPTRDPIGLNGYAYALSLGLGKTPEFDSFEEVESILRDRGEIFYDEDGMVLSLIGDYGFASSRPAEHRPHPQFGFTGNSGKSKNPSPN